MARSHETGYCMLRNQRDVSHMQPQPPIRGRSQHAIWHGLAPKHVFLTASCICFSPHNTFYSWCLIGIPAMSMHPWRKLLILTLYQMGHLQPYLQQALGQWLGNAATMPQTLFHCHIDFTTTWRFLAHLFVDLHSLIPHNQGKKHPVAGKMSEASKDDWCTRVTCFPWAWDLNAICVPTATCCNVLRVLCVGNSTWKPHTHELINIHSSF